LVRHSSVEHWEHYSSWEHCCIATGTGLVPCTAAAAIAMHAVVAGYG